AVVGGIDESAAKPAGAPAKAAEKQPAAAAAAPSPAAAPQADPAKQQLPSRANRGPVGTPPSTLARDTANTAPTHTPTTPAASRPATGDDVPATPLARKIAQERGVAIHALAGTGPGGRVREQDVLAFIQSNQNGAAPHGAPAGRAAHAGARSASRERMSPLRQRIASRLVEAQHTAAMLTTFNECDMTNVMALRSKHKEAFEKRHGVGLGFMSFFVKAAVSALRRFELVNAFIVEGEKGPEVEKHDYCDVAVAVGTPKGLVVPV